jgi:hypothetical protein
MSHASLFPAAAHQDSRNGSRVPHYLNEPVLVVFLISYLVIMSSSPQIIFISLISTREAASDGEAEEQCAT